MKQLLFFIAVLVATPGSALAQGTVAIKTNLLYDAMTNINLGVEVGLSKNTSLDISGQLNPWTYDKKTNSKLKHIMVQPEFRYWLCERFAGSFFAANVMWASYNIGAMDLPFNMTKNNVAKYRYNGNLYGAGVAYGYQWVFKKRWAIETEIGAGYALLNHKKYKCVNCGEYLGRSKRHYFGPTKAAVSLIYFLK